MLTRETPGRKESGQKVNAPRSQQQRNVVDKCDQDDDNNEVVRCRVEDAYANKKRCWAGGLWSERERSMNRARHDHIEHFESHSCPPAE